MEWTSKIHEPMSQYSNDGHTPIETTPGETQDISDLLEFEFYSYVNYHDLQSGATEIKMSRWLGVAGDTVGQAMCFYILKPNGRVVACSTICSLTKDEWIDEEEKEMRSSFDQSIREKMGNLTKY